MTTLRHAMWMGATGTLGLTLALASCNGGSTGPDPTTPAPTLTAVAPPLGPTSGTTTLTLTGTNFTSGTTVQIGTAMATGVAFVSPTQLTAVLPAQPTAFGKVPVVVARPDGQTAMSSELFSYYAVNVDFASGTGVAAGNTPAAAAAGDVNENYGSDYTGCLFTTCRSQHHVKVDRSAVISFPGYPSAA